MLGLQLQKKRWAGPRKEDTPAVPEGPEPGLGQDFGYHLLDTEVNGATVRMVKIQCPGVEHEDVSVDLLFNGCQVRLSRRAACGVAAAAWAKRFEFPTHEGIFEFWEDQMRLEHGFLHLIFRMRPFHSRRVRFPRHYTLTATDTDDWWDYPGAAVPAGKEAANLADSHVQDPRKVTPA
ncbi:unnamed protein product [Symbiodinium pilosum]|uniref:SHSP domain-containing protein n=1 Tax=Symbiodinium pilosum TaxID=2952 RepID=A0A812T5J7_SYMPI|nr:unnamed protein product [Symbiodinium pilosum]